MNGKKVTESALELMTMANADIKGIRDRIYSKDGFGNMDKILSATSAQIAVEKILKGYLRHNKIEIKQGHDLSIYYVQSFNLDTSFGEIEINIHNLNRYDANFKYTSKFEVGDNELVKILNDLKKGYTFPPFQKIYDEFMEKGLCEKIPVERFDEMFEEFDNIVNKDKMKEIESIAYQHFEDHEESRLSVNNGYLSEIQNISGLLPDNALEGTGRKLVYLKDDHQKSYFLERIYKVNKQDRFKSDLWEIKNNFSDLNAAIFIKNFEESREDKNDTGY